MHRMEHHASHVHQDGVAPAGKNRKSNLLVAAGAVAVILIIVAVANFGGSLFGGMKTISHDEAKTRAEKFINENLVSGTTASVTSVEEYSATMYKLAVKVGDNTIESYMTKDGITFFPQGMNVDNPESDSTASATPAAPVVPADLVKSDKPVVELFVMSHCPYGLQIEKGILPVADTLKDKMDLQIKYVDYVMHGEAKEGEEQLRQYCIGKEEKNKFFSYLKCFSVAGDAAGCGKEVGLNEGKVSSCIDKADKEFKVRAGFADKAQWNGSFPPFTIHKADNQKYGVQGSPTLVINGKQVESGRDPQSLLTTICAAFNNAPEECKAQLDSATPTPGFGTGTQASSGGSAAACAPAT